MAMNLMGKKRGMIQLFDEKGNSVGCTVLEVEPNIVTQIKTKEKDGYVAVQLGFDKLKTKDPRTAVKRLGKPLSGHYAKNNLDLCRELHETRLDSVDEYQLGQEITLDVFQEAKFVDVTAVTKGKGYQGVMKRHNYAGGPAAHGSGFHRHAGSRGMRSTPGRVLPLGKAAGHMGCEQQTTQSLRVVHLDPKENVIVVEGAVPGPNNGVVTISRAIKKTQPKAKK